jgi:hypothetical protein
MALSDVRARFVTLSGRYDLVNSDDSDNGANWYINKGQRWLDLHPLAPSLRGHYIDNVAADAYYLALSGCRAVHEVWINDDEDRVLLERKTVKWIKEEYSDVTSDLTSGAPAYWAPAIVRGVEVTDYQSLGTFLDYVVDEDSNETVQAILFAPPTEEAITVDVVGVFFNPTLSDDTDTSWWTENYDDILLLAALRKLESFMRNTAGVKDYNSVIQEELQMLDFAEVEQTVHNITRMTG